MTMTRTAMKRTPKISGRIAIVRIPFLPAPQR
jgi:hypothetical protein